MSFCHPGLNVISLWYVCVWWPKYIAFPQLVAFSKVLNVANPLLYFETQVEWTFYLSTILANRLKPIDKEQTEKYNIQLYIVLFSLNNHADFCKGYNVIWINCLDRCWVHCLLILWFQSTDSNLDSILFGVSVFLVYWGNICLSWCDAFTPNNCRPLWIMTFVSSTLLRWSLAIWHCCTKNRGGIRQNSVFWQNNTWTICLDVKHLQMQVRKPFSTAFSFNLLVVCFDFRVWLCICVAYLLPVWAALQA